jgi:dUTP pyrophosphatase
MINIDIKKITDSAKLPQKMTAYSAGYDMHSSNLTDILIKPGAVTMIPTGIAISLPVGYEAQIRPRSGLAIKHSIGVLNSPGTIDADYRGEIKIILFNFGKEAFTVEPGSRIAQMIISKHEIANFIETDILDETQRGSGGFGHTKV